MLTKILPFRTGVNKHTAFACFTCYQGFCLLNRCLFISFNFKTIFPIIFSHKVTHKMKQWMRWWLVIWWLVSPMIWSSRLRGVKYQELVNLLKEHGTNNSRTRPTPSLWHHHIKSIAQDQEDVQRRGRRLMRDLKDLELHRTLSIFQGGNARCHYSAAIIAVCILRNISRILVARPFFFFFFFLARPETSMISANQKRAGISNLALELSLSVGRRHIYHAFIDAIGPIHR